ncbi:MAG: corrinoid protein [Lachnospiraceae bacterium]|nr:corrinoid protein [Lachnospiraceae bacterium]MBQ9606686.1 corrinoid protein [Lachnospiraceae bacterium]
MDFEALSTAVQKGKVKDVKSIVNQALEENVPVKEILEDGLIAPMGIVGENFSANKIFVPEMLMAARAMSAGVKIIEPLFSESGIEPVGTVVIGTVKGDLHDIGKNLVAMMMRGAGLDVYDIGIDVPDEKFVEKAEEVGADIVCLSALLTTTMPAIGDVIKEFERQGVRDKYHIMIGGAPVSQSFADEVRADCYTPDASAAAEHAKEFMNNKKAS